MTQNRQYVIVRDSYRIWSPRKMLNEIKAVLPDYNELQASVAVEWWLHNIGYYVTLPIVQINYRCKDVDLMIRKDEAK